MGTADLLAQAQTDLQNARLAMLAQNYTGAIDLANGALALLLGIPDSSRMRDAISLRDQATKLIDNLLERERTLLMRSAGGIQRGDIVYQRPPTLDGDSTDDGNFC